MSSIIYSSSDEHPMLEIFEMYFLPLDFTVENYRIEVSTLHSSYYQNGTDLLNAYGLVLNDFIKYVNQKKKKVRLIEFLEYSIEESMISDSITEIKFKIKNDHILFKLDGEKKDWINMGEFYIDNYQINCCGSYMFISDILSDKQFMYYGD